MITVLQSFEFSNDSIHQNSSLFMALLDIDSLFTNILVDATINICIDLLFK